MKQIKRIIYSIGLFLLIGAMLCGTAFADVDSPGGGTFSDVPVNASYAEAVEELAAMGILAGYPDGTFSPDGAVNRAEAATIICRLLGVEDEALSMNNAVFSDVPSTHWAVGYVAKAAELGIIGGYGDGRFGPSDQVTYEQMVKMLVCAWGFRENAELSGGWPSGYIAVAKNVGIIGDNSLISNSAAPIPRWIVAQLSYNTAILPTNYEGGYIDESF